MAVRFRGNLWTDEETGMLISIWGRKCFQDELQNSVRNESVFRKIAEELRRRSYDRTPQQCRCKVKSLKAEYRAGKDFIHKVGGFRTNGRFFHLLDKVLSQQSTGEKTQHTAQHADNNVVAILELPHQDGSSPTMISEEFVVESQDSDEDNDLSADLVNGTSPRSSIGSCPVAIKKEYDPDEVETEVAESLEPDELEPTDLIEPESSNEKAVRKRKSTVKQIEDVLNRVLDNTVNKFIIFEQEMDKRTREETNSFRNKLLAIERRKLEESSSQTLQNERIINLMEALVSQRR